VRWISSYIADSLVNSTLEQTSTLNIATSISHRDGHVVNVLDEFYPLVAWRHYRLALASQTQFGLEVNLSEIPGYAEYYFHTAYLAKVEHVVFLP
jgi:hypothetical protein